jgi:hypothetical protein
VVPDERTHKLYSSDELAPGIGRAYLSASSCRWRTVNSSQKSSTTSRTTWRLISRATPSTLMRAFCSLPVASSVATSRRSAFTC